MAKTMCFLLILFLETAESFLLTPSKNSAQGRLPAWEISVWTARVWQSHEQLEALQKQAVKGTGWRHCCRQLQRLQCSKGQTSGLNSSPEEQEEGGKNLNKPFWHLV